MSSMASSRICLDAGLEPVMQLQARDRSRVVLESDAIGAAGLGISNVLCLSGDHQSLGPAPVAKPDQFDMDAIQLLWMLRRMRDEGRYLDGREIANPPRLLSWSGCLTVRRDTRIRSHPGREEGQRGSTIHPDPARVRSTIVSGNGSRPWTGETCWARCTSWPGSSLSRAPGPRPSCPGTCPVS